MCFTQKLLLNTLRQSDYTEQKAELRWMLQTQRLSATAEFNRSPIDSLVVIHTPLIPLVDPDPYLQLRSIVTSQNLQQIEDLAPTDRYRGLLGSH
jgi:hypothetical protein